MASEVNLCKNSYERRAADSKMTSGVLAWETVLQFQMHSWYMILCPQESSRIEDINLEDCHLEMLYKAI